MNGRYIGAGVIVIVTVIICLLCLWRYYNPPTPPPKEKLPQILGSTIDARYQPAAMPLKPADTEKPPPPPPPDTGGKNDKPAAADDGKKKESDDDGRYSRSQQGSGSTPPKPNAVFIAQPKKPTATDGTTTPSGEPVKKASNRDGNIVYAKSTMGGSRAASMGNPTFRLDTGLLPCELDWDVDSTFGGPIQCHVPMDIRPHGVTLLDRGTIITGYYDGNIRTGQKRLSASIDTIQNRAANCFATIEPAPMTEASGKSGVPGSVDNHYVERFGAAAAFAFTQAALNIVNSIIQSQNQNNRGSSNSYYNFGGSLQGNSLDQMARAILEEQMKIPPTVTLNRGSIVAVAIKQPIDFSDCYSLALRK